jgi:hypothetical protein
MPWTTVKPMDQKILFISDCLREEETPLVIFVNTITSVVRRIINGYSIPLEGVKKDYVQSVLKQLSIMK